MDKLFEQLPRIIAEAARSRLGILALVIATFSIIGVIFFGDAPVAVRITMFVFMSGAFAGFLLLAFRRHGAGDTPHHKTEEIGPREQSKKGGLQARGDEKLKDAENLRLSGRNDQARSAYEEARTFFKQVGDRLGKANVLLGLGDLERTLGRNDQARSAYEEARTLFKQVGDRLGEANVLAGLGDLESRLGRNDQARAAYEEARTLYKHEQNRLGEANVLLGLGHLERMLGRNDRARAAFEQARTLFKQVGDRLGEANVLRGLGRTGAHARAQRPGALGL